MKELLKILSAILILNILFLTGCGTDEKKDQVNSPRIFRNMTKVDSPKGTQKVTLGDTLLVKIVPSSDTVKIDSVVVGHGGKYWKALQAGEVSIPSEMISSVGIPRIIAKVYLSNKKTETFYPKFAIYPPAPKERTYKLIKEYPHDISSYTQGLFIKDGLMYEGTGQEGHSKLMTYNYRTGEIIKSIELEPRYFGEGIAYLDNKIYQLTYKAKELFVYDLNFNKINTYSYDSEGWGLTVLEDQLVMSDGTNQLYLRDKDNFEKIKTIPVYDNNGPVSNLNELEVIDGKVYANIYQTDIVVVINPKNGAVEERLNLSDIFPNRTNLGHQVDVLNGIAIHPETQKIFVTGKWWPKIYEIEIQ